MSQTPSHRDGHLMVAAVRLLSNREKHPPTDDELAQMLRWHPEQVRVITRGLEDLGILVAVKTPYDTRYEVGDYLGLEKLSLDDSGPGFADDLAEFEKHQQEEQERLEGLFKGSELEKKKRKQMEALDTDFGKFQKKKPANPFGDD